MAYHELHIDPSGLELKSFKKTYQYFFHKISSIHQLIRKDTRTKKNLLDINKVVLNSTLIPFKISKILNNLGLSFNL